MFKKGKASAVVEEMFNRKLLPSVVHRCWHGSGAFENVWEVGLVGVPFRILFLPSNPLEAEGDHPA